MAYNEKSRKNLITQDKRSPEERREIARKGAEASNKAQRERKTLKEELLLLLSQGDTQEEMSLSLIQQALNGNVKAFETIRDTIGEKPVEKVENEVVSKIRVDLVDE